MSSGMRLRATIRPPTRYGEGVSPDNTASLLQSIRSGREQSNREEASTHEQSITTTNVRHRPAPIRPRIVEYNPNLPPASFPSMNEPRPSGQNGAGQSNQPGNANVNTRPQGGSGRSLLVNGQYFENHIASNNLQNPTYARNMRVMAGARGSHSNTNSAFVSSSDTEAEGEDLSSNVLAGLDAAIPRNPAWVDLNPSLQAEIVMNLMHERVLNWWAACSKLGLTIDESTELSNFVKNRNKAIDREDKLLEEMRDKQLKVIMDLDRSEIKEHPVPAQLVVRKLAKDHDVCRSIAQSTYREIAKIPATGMLNAKVSDVLTARQYLGRRGLPRSLAGVWGNGLVTMIEGKDDDNEPERFEWKEDLRVKPKEDNDDTAHRLGPDALPEKEKRDLISQVGKETTVHPSNLICVQKEDDPARDFETNTPFWHSQPQNTPRSLSDAQASFQWKLDKARREAEETRRMVEKSLGCGEQTPTETQAREASEGAEGAEGLEETVLDYDWNDTSLFEFINTDGELVRTGVELWDLDTRLLGDAI